MQALYHSHVERSLQFLFHLVFKIFQRWGGVQLMLLDPSLLRFKIFQMGGANLCY